MNIAVLNVQVPFVRGGAERLVEGLVDALQRAGHRATAITAPFQWYPVERTLTAALTWRLFDLSAANGVPIDLVICTKYPTWAVQHPNKVAWLVHQHRQAYDWYGTPLSEFTASPADQLVRQRLRAIDRQGLGECRRRYAISANVAGRLERWSDLSAAVLYPPTALSGLAPRASDELFLSVARLDRAKRVDLFIEALARTRRPVRGAIVGSGNDEAALRRLAEQRGLGERLTFHGALDDAGLVALYNRCRAVVYAPLDEDYGLATIEAMQAGKPVLTAADSGGTLEFVHDGQTGAVCPPAADAFAAVLDRWADDRALCEQLGEAGRHQVAAIGWEHVVAELTAS